ncbi:hypothetical protein [Phycicoccus sp. 3266]|uniref:hypothetical protein n=1 Tax=Phycicoccus sp. 3266 TaxID=2817751 RepID=UPI00285EED5F|nr:hypothetical protein [Phycicoccus sp. 3266]MDR6861981.1 hypothetical protein [Phycicoccus sp. 3266]
MFGIDSEVNAALDSRFAGGPTRWLLLSQTEPVFDPDGYVGITEPDAPSYQRIQVPASAWPAAADRAVELDVIWPDTVDDLGVIGWWALADSPTPGQGVVAWSGRFAQPLELAAGTSNITLTLRVESPDNFTDLA